MAINPARPELMAGELLLDAVFESIPQGLSLVRNLGLHVWDVGSMLASLEATSAGVGLAGKQMKKLVGFNTFENDGIKFAAVAKWAHYPGEAAGYLFEQVRNEWLIFRGMVPVDAAGRLAVSELSPAVISRFGSNAVSMSNRLATDLIKRGKIFTGLPELAFGMGGGCFISNAVDSLLGEMIEKKFGAEWRSRASFISFFAPQILGRKLTLKFLSNKVASKLAPPVAAIAGAGFAYELISSSLRYLSQWDRANYRLGLGYEAVEKRPKGLGQPALEFVLGEGFSAEMCTGDNPLAWMVDGAEWLQSEVYGTRGRDQTCRYLRNNVRQKRIKEAEIYVEKIRLDLREFIAMSGHANLSQASLDVWKKLISAGWLTRVDRNTVGNVGKLSKDMVAMIIETSYIMEDVSEPVRELFSPDIETSGRLAKPGKEKEVIEWVGGEGAILNFRRRLFVVALIEAKIRGDEGIIDLGINAGYMKNSDEFVRPELYFTVLNDYVDAAIAKDDKDSVRSLQRYFERCYGQFIRERNGGDHALAGYYLANVLILDPVRIYGAGTLDSEFYERIINEEAKEFIHGCGWYFGHHEAARLIAESLERGVRDELAYHTALQLFLGAAPLEGPGYNEGKMVNMLKRAKRLREVSGTTGEALEILKLFMRRGALDDRDAVLAALGQGISVIQGEFKEAPKEIFELLRDKLKKILTESVMIAMATAAMTPGKHSAKEIFEIGISYATPEFHQKIAELAVFWKVLGYSGPPLGGAINEDGTLGDFNAIKKWLKSQ